MKIKMKYVILCLIGILMTISPSTWASINELQQSGRTITGVVKDSQGEPMPGVSIALKNGSTGTITDIDGNFSVSIPDDNTILVISFIGYKTQEVKVGASNSLIIIIEDDTQTLDEVVVVGYGVQKKVNLTGSVSNVAGEKLENRAVGNLSSALAGLSSGVSVTQDSGEPGSDNGNIRIRGLTTFSKDYRGPLVIIDGSPGDINSLNPNDVESITTLKDAASAAIYGSRGANGVILVTTKRGKQDTPARVTYSGVFTSTTPDNTVDLMSDYTTYMEMFNRAQTNMGADGKFSDSTISAWREASRNPNGMSEWGIPNWQAYPNTDWMKEMFKSNFMQQHNLSIVGGSKTTNYQLSLGALDNPGTLDNTAMQRYNVRINVDTKVTDFLKVGTQTYMMKEFKEAGDTEFKYFYQTTPGMVGYHDGKYGAPEADGENKTNTNNLLRFVNMKGGKKTKTRISTSWYAEVDIMKGLKGKINANYQDYSYAQDIYSKYTETYSFRNKEVVASSPTLDAATTSFSLDRQYEYTLTGTLNYMNTFGDHDINVLAGYEQYYYNTRTNNSQKKGLIDFSIHDMQSAAEMDYINSSTDDLSERDYAMISYFGRVNYAYKSRYLFEANIRRDGSSKFAPDSRWSTFPSVSAGWRISEESFMESTRSFMDNLKLRISWGKLGNVTSGYYDWLSAYEKVNYSFGGNISNGLAIRKIGNPEIKWENITSSGIGLDASFLNNRLSFEFDYYNKTTEGILTSPSMYLTAGNATAPTRNTSDMRNRGIEFTVGWNDQIKDFRYGVNVNFSYNQNKITKYLGKMKAEWEGDEYKTNVGQTSSIDNNMIRTEGHIFDEFYLREVYKGTGSYYDGSGKVDPNGGPRDGMIRTPEDMKWVEDMKSAGYKFQPKNDIKQGQLYYGEFIYADHNGDGIYGNDHDRAFTGKSSIPKYTLGMTFNAAWKGFDFSMTWAGNFGMYYYIYERGINSSSVNDSEQIARDAASKYYYFNENNANDPANNINGKYPALKYGSESIGNHSANANYLYDASYLRLKNLQIGYTLPKSVISKLYIQNLRVSLSAENLITITDFPGMDPEFGNSINKYPLSRRLSAGINVTF